jgi:predicted glycosyltransferase
MRSERKDGRILIYAHDTFGLGHLRRCRAIAHALVEDFKHLSVLILSGSRSSAASISARAWISCAFPE